MIHNQTSTRGNNDSVGAILRSVFAYQFRLFDDAVHSTRIHPRSNSAQCLVVCFKMWSASVYHDHYTPSHHPIFANLKSTREVAGAEVLRPWKGCDLKLHPKGWYLPVSGWCHQCSENPRNPVLFTKVDCYLDRKRCNVIGRGLI
jgi:hypothetical protein